MDHRTSSLGRSRAGGPEPNRADSAPIPGTRQGKEFRIVTHGNAWSVYFADPEGNRVELFVDTPWHTLQPFAEPLDIEAPVDAILAQTEAICRSRPGFVSHPEWRQAVAERMATA